MSNLSNQQINQTFDGILQVPGGITSTLKTVQDGNGNPTGLQLSSAGASVTTSSTFVASRDGTALTGTVPRLISDGFGDYISVEDFGAIGDGITDDTAAFQAAIDSIATLGGGTVTFQKRYLIDTALIIKDSVSLQGPLALPDELLPSTTADYDAKQGVLIVNSSITITVRDSASLGNCMIIRKGLDLPFPDAATATAGIAAFAGTAITVSGAGTYFHHLLILGFNKALYSSNYERVRCEYVQGDCTNGIDIRTAYDICQVENCHFWPWTTTHQTWTTSALLVRPGIAYSFQTVGDWSKFTNSFCYGYNIGFYINSCNSVTLLGCGADYAVTASTSTGYYIDGTSNGTGLISCQAAAQGTGVLINSSIQSVTRLVGCQLWSNDNYHIQILQGSVIIDSNDIRSDSNAVLIYGIATGGSNASYSSINNRIQSVQVPDYFFDDTSKQRSTIWGNTYYNCSGSVKITTNDNTAPAWEDYTWNSTSAGMTIRCNAARGTAASPLASQTSDVLGGLAGYGYTGTSHLQAARIACVVAATPTSTYVPGAVQFGTTDTFFRYVTIIDKDGNLKPAADNAYNLGTASNRWATVYAATGTINTSDERVKTNVRTIDDVVFKAWAKVEYCQYKFIDAVESKGDGARWHFGCIAQRIKDAFESEGLNAFEYGLLCYDEWESEPAIVDEDGAINCPAIEAGNRYGVRYEEALALECAYLRHVLLNKK